MSDFISELEQLKRKNYIEFCKAYDDAKLPNDVDITTNTSIVVLYAANNYEIYTGTLVDEDGHETTDADVEIDTGVKIKHADNVELTAFAPVNLKGFNDTIIEKQSELWINPDSDSSISFKASELFRISFLNRPPTTIRIKKGDPICFLKVAPITQAWMCGVQYE